MYDTDGDFGRVRLSTRSQFREYENFFNCIRICGWHCCNDKYRINRLSKDNDSHLILYTVSGCGELSMNGTVYKLLPATSVIIKENTGASYYTPRNGIWEFYWIHFNGKPCKPLLDLICAQTQLVVPFENDDCIKALTEYALADQSGESLAAIIKVSGMLSHMLHRFISYQTLDKLTQHGLGTVAESTIAYITNHYHENIEITDISNSLYMSREHLIRVFKKQVGLSPYAYLCKFRVEKAKELLRLTNISVEKISQMVGFKSHSNFSKQFKTAVGVTPTAYKNGCMK